MTDTVIVKQEQDGKLMEGVLLGGDLSKLSPAQRVSYYQKVCESLGLNPLTKPFDYIQLNGKLTLYARKDAADQLRKIHEVSIDDADIKETDTQFIVKVKGHDKTGRSDVEVGVVNKSDMNGNTANAQMKAVTKAKRRLTLSLCGLGWLDETEIETIPGARPVPGEWEPEVVKAGEDSGDASTEIENQATGKMERPIQLIKPLSDAAIKKAMSRWNMSYSDAAKEIGRAKLAPMTEEEFNSWLDNGRVEDQPA